MERRLVKKMIQQCFLQYEHQLDTVPLGDKDYEWFYDEITKK
jgi:YqzH-like protein